MKGISSCANAHAVFSSLAISVLFVWDFVNQCLSKQDVDIVIIWGISSRRLDTEHHSEKDGSYSDSILNYLTRAD